MPDGPDETLSPEPSQTPLTDETLSASGATPGSGATRAGLYSPPPVTGHPKQIGPYLIVSLLGEGGMGQVFQAEQLQPVRRMVALKVIRLGMDSREVLARFEAERQALALMNHPNVAKVYDAGVTDRGQPFFAMEVMSGVPLTSFCDEQKLSTRQRLAIFVHICHAVQHAHQKGIIHRDLKPSNILVSMVDEKPVPKVIDFGIAKATGEGAGVPELLTSSGMMVGTLAYMSPEQAAGSLDVDTRTDIYSLGVVLYELLTGELPLDPAMLRSAGIEKAVRMIREAEPKKPSTRLGTRGKNSADASAGRQGAETTRLARSDRRTRHRELRSDLDWITLKAIERERNRRYDTANSLAADIERHLNDEPVLARPPTLGYRLTKLARRREAAVTATGLVALALVAGMAGTTYGFVSARAERDKVLRARENEMHQRSRAEKAERDRRLQMVDELLTASPDAVAAIINSLKAMPDLVGPPLWKKFDDPAATPQQRLRSACALAAIAKQDRSVIPFLVNSVLTAPAAESDNVINALRYGGETSIDLLKQTALKETGADAIAHIPNLARYSFTLLSLGNAGGVSIGMRFRPDPSGRATFINTFASWHGDLRPAAVFMLKPDNPYSRSGLCAAVGTLDPASLPASDRQAVTDALMEIFRTAPDGGSHSAAAWALRRWGIPLPKIDATKGPVPNRDWYVNGLGMTMLRLSDYKFMPAETIDPPAPAGQAYSIPLQPYFICDSETSIAAFQQFAKDPAVPAAEKPANWPGPDSAAGPTGDCPVQNVNLMDAMGFCNWLSRHEGRQPFYVYKPAPNGPGTWSLNLDSDGYRLPSGAEWECACRAGTLSRFPFGDEPKYLMDYVVIGEIRDLPCATKQPNAWGLFDMLGNAWEMTWQNATGKPPTLNDLSGTPPASGSYVMRGGSFDGGTAYTTPGVMLPNPIDRRSASVGFRVVCRMKER